MAEFSESGPERPSQDPFGDADSAVERRTQEIGRELLAHARSVRGSLLSSSYWSDRLLDWAMSDDAFKRQMFRFIDVFPALQTPEQVHDHLVDLLAQPGVTLPTGLGLGLKAGSLLKGAMAKTIAGRIRSMAARFIAGRDPAAALPMLEKLWSHGSAHTITLLGEKCLSFEEAHEHQQTCIRLLRELSEAAGAWPMCEQAERDHLGPIPRVNLSLKLSALHPTPDPVAGEALVAALHENVRPILDEAGRLGAQIHFDNEQHALKDLIFEVFLRCADSTDIPIGVVLQAYLREAEDDARRLIDYTERTGRQITIRLVKGAYWDYETEHARDMGWPVPVWSRKAETDACFERVARMLIEAAPRTPAEGGVKLALGSHNARSIAAVLALVEARDLPREAVELQMLYGMADHLKAAAARMNLRVREYVPVGEMIPGMAYLVRRLLENTSNESWLKMGLTDGASADELLTSPHPAAAAPAKSDAERPVDEPFLNEPRRNFARQAVRDETARAIERAHVPEGGAPSSPDDAEAALSAAHDASDGFAARPVSERAAMLISVARIMRDRRDELTALIVREAGMCRRDADVEVCRAIDFCAFHARQAAAMHQPEAKQHRPRGVTVVRGSFNSPLAAPAGMATAALAMGNTVILRPAVTVAGVGRVLCDIMIAAGFGENVIRLVTGDDTATGAVLTVDRRIALIASSEITPPPVNTIIIDASADLEEAVLGVRASAFAWQGQFAASCSRVIVLASSHDAFLQRMCESTRALKIGDPLDPAVTVGPVIDAGQRDAICDFIEEGRNHARTALAMELPDPRELMPGRPYVAPHIFSDVQPASSLATASVFGPVLAVMKAASFDEAIELANAADACLAAGVYARKPSNIDRARRELNAAAVFVNQPIIGARVGRRPFGGFSVSGRSVQAGDATFLLHFVQPETTT